MSELQKAIYQNYVSGFKKESTALNKRDLGRLYKEFEHRFLPLLSDLPKDSPILELGCGPGYFMSFLKAQGFEHIKGLDISQEQVDIAQANGCDAETADVFTFLEAAEQEYKLIVAIDFIEHFTKDEAHRLCSLIHSRLSEGGLLILNTPNGEGFFSSQVIYGDLSHHTIFNPGSLKQLLAVNGFEAEHIVEVLPGLFNVKNYFRRFIWRLFSAGLTFMKKIETGKTQKIWTENLICVARKKN